MPFKSEAQRRFMWMHHPRIAKRWAHEGRNKGLPARAGTKRTKRPTKKPRGGRGKRLK
jgi:hypothetical protein